MTNDYNIIITIGTWGNSKDDALSSVEHILEVIRDNVAGECYDIKVECVGVIDV